MEIDELKHEYKTTSYCVEAPGEEIRLRIDQYSAQFDELLTQLGASQWAFITAYNPRSNKLSREQNVERHEFLARLLKQEGYTFLPCRGVDDHGKWPTEPGFVIFGIERSEAERLGRRFDQYAILFGQRNGYPELVMLVDDGSMAAECGATV